MRVLSPLHQAQRQTSLHLDAVLADLGVTAQEAQLVAFVAARDGVPVTAVVKLLGVSKSTVTSMLRRLEGVGLLERETNRKTPDRPCCVPRGGERPRVRRPANGWWPSSSRCWRGSLRRTSPRSGGWSRPSRGKPEST